MLTFLRRIPGAGSSTLRPRIARQDTQLLPSYYQSPLADQGLDYSPKRPTHRRTKSGDSTSSSDYSSDSASTSDHSIQDPQPTTRRPSVPSEGGADRRRLAIVQMDPVREAESPTSSSAVRSRRGLETRLDGLALVAPPDAAPNSYEYLHPPTSAPPIDHRSMSREDKGHSRSASEAPTTSSKGHKSKPSRDVGIVGTASPAAAPLESPKILPRIETAPESLRPPVFQEPHSSRAGTPNTAATPSPSDTKSLLPPIRRRSTELSIHTPEIGQSKEIHVPVASPVVVDLGPDASLRVGNSSFDRRSPALRVVEPRAASPPPLSSYLHYQPGLHATAGPLPPPPRAIFNIDPSTPPPPRPPRLHSPPPRSSRRGDLDAVNQPLQLAVSAVMSSSGSSTPASTSRSVSPLQPVDAASSEDSQDEANHRREGAFSPSIISTTPSTSPSDYSPTTAHPGPAIDSLIPGFTDASKIPVGVGSSKTATAPMVIPAPRMESLPEHRGEEWTHISRDLTASPSSDGHVSQDRVSWESYSPSSHEGVTPSPPPKSFKANLTNNLKRFSSLPRTPSPSSKSLSRLSGSSTRSHARTPSPTVAPLSLPIPIPMPRRRKIISRNPPALSSADIMSRRSALERCALYAQKINELYVLDCGLSDWVVAARGSKSGKRATLTPSTPRGAPQPRHVSRSSMKSEATFPRRHDAMVATDLSTKPSDIAPAVPALPYPALSPRSTPVNIPSPSMRTATSPTPSKTSNFFSSLGRKASMSKRDPPKPMSFSSSGPPTTGTRLTKSPPMTMNPRAILISNAPVIPGGPRAPPNRALRTQSIAAPPSPFSSNSSMSDHSSLAAPRRPSLWAPPSSSGSSSQSRGSTGKGVPDREFERQVDKLADLLPQAERAVLAGYLRRSGQDILAIGQYLEDEKNGKVRRD
ncbi:hypothetical protein C8R47DRAFT_780277 [Mycena vitilis]|nr:hypothetical protein C8R47DRAFT_780277 [Mycena vitilis]